MKQVVIMSIFQVVIACLSLFARIAIYADNTGINQQLRLAYTLEKSGQAEKAQRIYENLYSRYPQAETVYQRLIKNYFDQHRFGKVKKLIKQHQSNYPEDSGIDIYQAEWYYRVQKPDSALCVVKLAASQSTNRLAPYLDLGSRLMASRLFDEAISVYLAGREQTGEKHLFAINLANCYQYNLDYVNAAQELLHYYDSHPKQFNYVERQILRFPMTFSVIGQVLPVLRMYLQNNPRQKDIELLIMKLMIKDEQYDQALKLVQQMEARVKDKSQAGAHLFLFGQQAEMGRACSAAQKAYESVLQDYPHYPHKNNVWLKLADVQVMQRDYIKAQQAYTRAYDIKPHSPIGRKALLSRGRLERDQLKLFDEAIHTFNMLKNQFPHSQESHQAKLELANTYIVSGTLNEAQNILADYLKMIQDTHNDYVPVVFNLAQCYYYNGEFSKTLKLLKELTLLNNNLTAMQNPYLNDGLALMQFVSQVALRDSILFTSYSHAEWLIKQEKFDQAAALLDSLINNASHALTVYPISLKANMYYNQAQWQKSLSAFQEIINTYPHHQLAEEALYYSGRLYFNLRQKDKAIEQLERFLEQFPFSFYKNEVLSLIRDLEV